MEQWRDVVGYEGLYRVSSEGRVMTVRGNRELRQSRAAGYRTVTLSRNGGSVKRYVHDLILRAFVGPRPTGNVARHLNDIPDENRLDNLAWGTRRQNYEDAVRNGSTTPAAMVAQTNCNAKNHDLGPESWRFNGKGWVSDCAECKRERARTYREAMSPEQLERKRTQGLASYHRTKRLKGVA